MSEAESHRPPPILGSMRPDGSRLTVHPADVSGRWLTARRVVFLLLIGFYLAAPFVPIGGRPMIRLDVEHRRFFLFGGTFNSQDFWMVVLLALSFVFALLAVTAWRGRVWCGWACPQTVFLEAWFRPLERWLDGPRARRIELERAPWSAGKIARRAVKLVLFAALSIALGHAATAIFVGPKDLFAMILDGPGQHQLAFGLSTAFAAICFFNFAWFREQFCVVVCPYGRLQSVLHDRDSVTVAYDEPRGEPRGKLSRAKQADAPELGDCIDCHRCVVVCPTAIDIRNGMQMECLACLQCVDACDEVMTKIGKPRGLIGLYSQRELGGGGRRTVRPRLAVYVALFLVASTTLVASLATRTTFEANVLRPRGANPFVVDGDEVRNAFEIHLVNKNPSAAEFHVSVRSPVEAEIVVGTPVVRLESLSDARVPLSISIEREELGHPVELELVVEDVTHHETKTSPIRFLTPFGTAGTSHD